MLDRTTAYGLDFLFPLGDEVIGRALRAHGEFARPEVELISAYLDILEPGAFIDVGANIGAICLPLAAARPAWTFWALEGNRPIANLLAANAMANGLLNVEPVHAVAGPIDGMAAFPASSLRGTENFGAAGLHRHGERETLRMTRLDTFAPPSTRFIKIDVEGFEAEVLKGATRLLSERSVAWLIEAKPGAPATPQALNALWDAGYQTYWFYAPFVTFKPNKPGSPMVKEGGDVNCLALPPGMPNLWDLTQAVRGDAPPIDFASYPYLANYGFRAAG